jgi:hypothetical protein
MLKDAVLAVKPLGPDQAYEEPLFPVPDKVTTEPPHTGVLLDALTVAGLFTIVAIEAIVEPQPAELIEREYKPACILVILLLEVEAVFAVNPLGPAHA